MAFSTAIGLQVVGGAEQARAQKQAGRLSRQLGDYNAELAEDDAAEARRRGEFVATRVQSDTQQLRASQRAALAAQGIDINSGSAAEVQAGTEIIGELDALYARNNATLEALGYRTQGRSLRIQGANARARAQSDATATLLTSGARAAEIYYRKHR